MDVLMILLIWLIAPFAELGIIIVLAVLNNKYKKRIDELSEKLMRQNQAGQSQAGQNQAGQNQTGQKQAGQNQAESQIAGTYDIRVPEDYMDAQMQPEIWNVPEGLDTGMNQCSDSVAGNESKLDTSIDLAGEFQSVPESVMDEITGEMNTQKISTSSQTVHTPVSTSDSVWAPAPTSAPALTPAPAPTPAPPASTPSVSPAGRSRAFRQESGFYQGTAALIIGVVFVVLAGLIFATTAWHVLPSFCKVVIALGFSGLFFGASLVADRVFRIVKTSQAFYILGSVFLFLSVLAAGYFGLLGQEFILAGDDRWRVLWAGSAVTELALFAGLKKFRDRIYTQACLWGMTVSMTFLLGALKLGLTGCVNGMVYYSFALLVWNEIRIKRRNNRLYLTETLEQGIGFFVPLHFWIFSVLISFQAALGFMKVLIGYSYTGIFAITSWSALALGMVSAGITLMALRCRSLSMKILHSISLVVFFHYTGFCIPADFTYQLLTGAAMSGVWFLAERRKDSPLISRAGGSVFTAILAADTAVLMLIALLNRNGIEEQMAASAAIILLAAVLVQWSRQYSVIRRILPLVLFGLTMTGYEILRWEFGLGVRYDVIVLVYILALAMWDVFKRDCYQAALLVLGTGSQIIFWLIGWSPLPFFVFLAVYLLARSLQKETAEINKNWYVKGSCLYFLAGVHIIAGSMTDNGVVQMIWVVTAYGAEYAVECAVAYFREKKVICPWFWDITGSAVFFLTMSAYYLDPGLALWNVVPCLVLFAVFYVKFYRGSSMWPHLVATLAVLPVPGVVAARYGIADTQVYAITAAIALVSGILFRWYRPVIRQREHTSVAWEIDWFHILIIIDLLPMTWMGVNRWRSAYILLTALYVLQYTVLDAWRKGALTLSMALTVLAFWQQQFIQWPELLSLEVQIIPAALSIWLLPRIWKNEKFIPDIQTVLYIICLGIMVLDAFRTGSVGDALILEVVCLAIFLWAHVRKCGRWVRISGIVIVTVALYMTKNFWLSLSWWVYLLAAGLGLIIFAAVNEMKRH